MGIPILLVRPCRVLRYGAKMVKIDAPTKKKIMVKHCLLDNKIRNMR